MPPSEWLHTACRGVQIETKRTAPAYHLRVVPPRYEKEGSVDALLRDVAGLGRRVWLRGLLPWAVVALSIALFASIVPMAMYQRGEPLLAIAAGFLVFIFRPKRKPWLAERVAFARDLLGAPYIDRARPASLKLDLGDTERKELEASEDPDGFRHEKPEELRFYVNPWLEVGATLTDGAVVRMARRSRVQRRDEESHSSDIRGTVSYREFSSLDDVEVKFPDEETYRGKRPRFKAQTADEVAVPDGFSLISFEAGASSAHIVVRSYEAYRGRHLQTGVPAGLVLWVELIYALADVSFPADG